MIRLFHLYLPSRTLLLAVSDLLFLVVALVLASLTWFRSGTEMAFGQNGGLARILTAAAICLACLHYYDLYDSSVLSNVHELWSRTVQLLGTLCIVLSLLYFAYPAMQLGRGPLLIWILLIGMGLIASRRLFISICHGNRLKQRAVLVGKGPLTDELVSVLRKRPELGIELVGYLEDAATPGPIAGLQRLGGIEDGCSVVDGQTITKIIVTSWRGNEALPIDRLLQLKAQGIQIESASELFEAATGKVPLETETLTSILFSSGFGTSKWTRLCKSVLSIVFSACGFLVTLPLMGLIALAIRLDSPGPVIFRQTRVGQGGRPFVLYKFRSMFEDADSETPAGLGDERCTRVGGWLRKLRLDELPQLINVLRGDMDFVGPRPFVPATERECVREIPFYSQRWLVKPGATGWAQVQQGYCATLADNSEKFAYDLFYIKNMCIGLDLLIVFQTIKILLLGRGAR